MECLLSAEWKSPNKIVARSGQAKGKGEIVVVTRSGGVGSCTVTFKGYFVQTGKDSNYSEIYHINFTKSVCNQTYFAYNVIYLI